MKHNVRVISLRFYLLFLLLYWSLEHRTFKKKFFWLLVSLFSLFLWRPQHFLVISFSVFISLFLVLGTLFTFLFVLSLYTCQSELVAVVQNTRIIENGGDAKYFCSKILKNSKYLNVFPSAKFCNYIIYRWFLIRSCDNLSLVIPNNKTVEHWQLKV